MRFATLLAEEKEEAMSRCQLFGIPNAVKEVRALAGGWPSARRRLDNQAYAAAKSVWERNGWVNVTLSLKPDAEVFTHRAMRAVLDLRDELTDERETAIAAIAYLISEGSSP